MGKPWTALTAAQHLGYRVCIATENGFDRTIAAIAHPTVASKRVSLCFHPCSIAYPLNTPFYTNMHRPGGSIGL